MEIAYTSKYGKIIKRCPGTHEYWHKGKLIAKGSSISSPNPNTKPTREDWEYCRSLVEANHKSGQNEKGAAIYAAD